ncbi:Aminodeoxychorismate lyase [hydrothermal vent metagenome]|uniref:aminodeoxychorismate lyase n=1 Tax=hydrothermal vent metagenome TaxID=652676 RepID=A0A3B0ZD36_9ZZZZ
MNTLSSYMRYSLVNGQTLNQIATTDRGLLYGDGLFETLLLERQQLYLWSYHYQRLCEGCLRLGIAVPDESLLLDEMKQVISHAQTERSIIKLLITRGDGGRGYRAPTPHSATRIIQLFDTIQSIELVKQGIRARICNTTLGRNVKLAGIKHLNRLEQVLARSEWQHTDIHEGVMLDSEGYVVEGTMSNLFLVIDDVIVTPKLNECGVHGIIRRLLIEQQALLPLPMKIRHVHKQELYEANEIFFTNSLIGVWPVQQLENHRYAKVEIAGELSQKVQTWQHEFCMQL